MRTEDVVETLRASVEEARIEDAELVGVEPTSIRKEWGQQQHLAMPEETQRCHSFLFPVRQRSDLYWRPIGSLNPGWID